MCGGYHARLSREEQANILKQRKKNLEDRLKEVEKELADLKQEEPATAYQGA